MSLIIAWIVVGTVGLALTALFVAAIIHKVIHWREWLLETLVACTFIGCIILLVWSISVLHDHYKH